MTREEYSQLHRDKFAEVVEYLREHMLDAPKEFHKQLNRVALNAPYRAPEIFQLTWNELVEVLNEAHGRNWGLTEEFNELWIRVNAELKAATEELRHDQSTRYDNA